MHIDALQLQMYKDDDDVALLHQLANNRKRSKELLQIEARVYHILLQGCDEPFPLCEPEPAQN